MLSLREGRCALASALACYKYIIMFGQLASINQVVNAYFHIDFTEWWWVLRLCFVWIFVSIFWLILVYLQLGIRGCSLDPFHGIFIAISESIQSSFQISPDSVHFGTTYCFECVWSSCNQFSLPSQFSSPSLATRLVRVQEVGLYRCERSPNHRWQLWVVRYFHRCRLSVYFLSCCIQLWIFLPVELVPQLCLRSFLPTMDGVPHQCDAHCLSIFLHLAFELWQWQCCSFSYDSLSCSHSKQIQYHRDADGISCKACYIDDGKSHPQLFMGLLCRELAIFAKE